MLQPHPHHKAHLVAVTVLTAFAVTLAFHFLLIPAGHGFGFVLFAAVLIAGMLVLAVMASKPLNIWALLFLLPVAFSLAAETLYASNVVAALGFLITFVSLAFFAYWLTVPRLRFDEVTSLWPMRIVPEVLLPVGGLQQLFAQRGGKRKWSQMVGGAVLAVPFLIVIGALFAGADPLFRSGIEGLFDNDALARNAARIFRDVLVLLFFLGSGWLMVTRAIEGRRPRMKDDEAPALDRTLVMTFLALVNALFLVFLVFQAIYFFGGEEIVRSSGLTYAEYARQGFFQLLAVAGIVFALVWALYRMTDLREWGTRGLSLLLIVQTGVVIASAVKRLLLYIDAYGLTVSRYWAMVVILLIAVVLVACLVGALAKIRYHALAKYAFPGVLIVVSALLLFNVEGFVVRLNTQRYLSGRTSLLDINYMFGLSTDAVPEMVALTRKAWPYTKQQGQYTRFTCTDRGKVLWEKVAPTDRDFLIAYLSCPSEVFRSQSDDWRQMTVSTYRARAAIAELGR